MLICCLATTGYAANYADERVAELAERARSAAPQADPLRTLLLAEELYFMGHETGDQDKLAETLVHLYEHTEHQELRAEMGYFLTQQYRQTRQPEKIEKLIKELGYVNEWQLLGPLATSADITPHELIDDAETKGLERSVSWIEGRAYGDDDYWHEGLGHYGYFSTNQAVYPNQLAGVLATTWFYLPKKGHVRLGLGWQTKARAWVNRTQVFDSTYENDTASPDQAVVTMKLRRGWHRLSLFVASGSEEPNLGFFVRLTDVDGHPLECQADRGKSTPRRKPKIQSNGETALADLAKTVSPYALASVLMIKEQSRHPQYGNLRELFGRAYAEAPSRILVEKLLSLTEEPNERWKYLSDFLASLGEPASDPYAAAWTLTQLGQVAIGQDRYWEARQYAQKALKVFPDYWPATVLENNALSALGLEGLALRRTLELLEKYPDVPWLMMDLADLYNEMSFLSESEAMVDRVLAIRFGSRKFSNAKIRLLKQRGDLEGLERFYHDVLRDGPYSVTAAITFADFLTGNRRYEEAYQLLDHYLDQVPQNPDLLQAMGEMKLRGGAPDALTYLEQALALRPQNPGLENLIRLSKDEAQAFYKPYLLQEPPDVDPLEVSSVVINFDNKVRKVAPSGQSSLYHQLEWEIVSERGIQELTGYSFSYAPLREKAEIVKAEIIRGDQTILITKTGRSRISDPQYRMYYDLVAYQIRFPSLQVGDRVRVEYRVDDIHSTNIFGDYFGDLQYFSNGYPSKRIAYTLILPKDRKIYTHVEKMQPEHEVLELGNNRVYRWIQDQVSPYETESRMPGLQAYLPYIGVSTFADWQDMAKWYAELIKNQLELNHESKEIVADLVEGVTDRLEIVKRIHEYVVSNTRYVALEFGIHGYKPYGVNQVCSRQFGDCKDKASLMIAMMREAGIEANVVIVRTSDKGDIHPSPAMLSYFNHAIAHVPEFNLFLDGTAEFSGIDELPEMDQDALVLIVDREGNGELTRIPRQDNTRTDYHLVLNVAPDGQAQIEGELRYSGVVTPDVRQYLSIETKLNQNLQNILTGIMPGLDVINAEREGTRLNDPIKLRFTGQSDQLLATDGQGLKLPLNILNSGLVQRYAPNANRKFPLEIGSRKTRQVQVDIELPQGYEMADAPESLSEENDDFKVHIQFDRTGTNQMRIDYEITFKNPRVPPSNYAELRELMKKHDRILDQAIQFIAR
ncbi:DUF3857 and transglutaminase domain-containing protein [Sulfidibacter corallicola]|uniref:DUF3857 domain-containing protein n=1 Tax=Sulfidibacter corallicola TaxID=2818388 RepID=A0A8A4U3S4_SULCO|nr:DUF3857 and transglutaminase domain-containing protein [Sulfidibacter corallicola]QTD53395.1 DUF3857 domain-containing protein [Sulfidibacter corallicola]